MCPRTFGLTQFRDAKGNNYEIILPWRSESVISPLMKWTSLGFNFAISSWLFAATWASAELPRERLLMDSDWKFHLGDDWPNALRLDKAGASGGPAAASFGDASWRVVTLPHDWAVELPFDSGAD